MPTITYTDLINNTQQIPYKLNWAKVDGGVNKIVFPKEIVGTKANIIILTTDHFPTQTSSDALAYFALLQAQKEGQIGNYGIKICALDRFVSSFAWAGSILGIKCKIHCPQATLPYWVKKAKDYGADITFEGTTRNDVAKITDLNRTRGNILSIFETPTSYTYQRDITMKWIEKAIEGVGNNKIALFIFPSSTGDLSGAAEAVKKAYPYSKSMLVEPSLSPMFYRGKKGEHKQEGYGYGFIPLIHNLLATDYVMLIDDEENSKVLKCITEFSDVLMQVFKAESRILKPIIGKMSFTTTAAVIAAINMARQLRLDETDNIVIVSEDTTAPYMDILKNIHIHDIDVKHIIEESLMSDKFRPVLDVTGQRQRERLFKKKRDYWMKRGFEKELLDSMTSQEYWDKLPAW